MYLIWIIRNKEVFTTLRYVKTNHMTLRLHMIDKVFYEFLIMYYLLFIGCFNTLSVVCLFVGLRINTVGGCYF
jgi:hypothetical protein